MTRRTTYAVACLSGHGIGPEVMMEASRTLAQVSRLHGFSVEETHPLFGGEAVPQSGHALPSTTRRATLGAPAILVAAAEEPALAGVESELADVVLSGLPFAMTNAELYREAFA